MEPEFTSGERGLSVQLGENWPHWSFLLMCVDEEAGEGVNEYVRL